MKSKRHYRGKNSNSYSPEELAKELTNLPREIIIEIFKSMLNIEGGVDSFYSFINSGSYELIMPALNAGGINSFNLMDTKLWCHVLFSIGYDFENDTFIDNPLLPWKKNMIDSQKKVIENFLYTSRVHDLLEICSNQGENPIYRAMANSLLEKLYNRRVAFPSTTDINMHNRELLFLSRRSVVTIHNDYSIRTDMHAAIDQGGMDRSYIDEIKYWDVRRVTDMSDLFEYIHEIDPQIVIDFTYWDTSRVVNMQNMFFREEGEIQISGLENWNTCRVKHMRSMFRQLPSFNCDISLWDVSNVRYMSRMFTDSTEFNKPISNWNTSQVIDMTSMFSNAESFNQPLNWDVKNVQYMDEMFSHAQNFNNALNFKNMENVISMSNMFNNATNFNQRFDFNGTIRLQKTNHMFFESNFNEFFRLNTQNVDDMSFMFCHAPLFNMPLAFFNTSNVLTMEAMFEHANSFNQKIGNWDTRNVKNMYQMFDNANAFNQEIGEWITGNVLTMNSMFSNAESFNQPLNWDVRNVQNMEQMFSNATSFNGEIGNWKTENVKSMDSMFENATSFNQPLNWNIMNANDLSGMFKGATSFNSLLNLYNTKNVKLTKYMFQDAIKFNQSLSFDDMTNIKDMSFMFHNAISWNKQINLGQHQMRRLKKAESIFIGTNSPNDYLNWFQHTIKLNERYRNMILEQIQDR
jgi:surface protein